MWRPSASEEGWASPCAWRQFEMKNVTLLHGVALDLIFLKTDKRNSSVYTAGRGIKWVLPHYCTGGTSDGYML